MRMNIDLAKEKELLENAKASGAEFEKLYKYFLNDIYRFSFSLLGNQHDAEDITSQTFIELHKKLNSFEWQNISLKYWLFRTAKNISLKKLRRVEAVPLDETYMISDEHEISFVDEIIEKDLIDRIKKEIEQLHPEERAVINLRIWEGMSFRDIGEINGLSEDAARMRFNRSIQKLRDSLENKNIKKLLALPILFTAISKAGALSTYAAPASLSSIGFISLITQKMTTLTTIKSLLASKAGVAAITGLVAVTATGGAFIAYDKVRDNNQKQNDKVVLQTPTPTPTASATPTALATSTTSTTPTPTTQVSVSPSPTTPIDPYQSWKSYTNTKYNLTFRYPSDWSVKEKDSTDCTGGIVYNNNFQPCTDIQISDTKKNILHVEVAKSLSGTSYGGAAGDFQRRGNITFLNKSLPMEVLVLNGVDKEVHFNDTFSFKLSDQAYLLSLRNDESSVDYGQKQISQDVEQTAVKILESFRRN